MVDSISTLDQLAMRRRVLEGPHQYPAANTPINATLLEISICNFNSIGMGRTSSMKSITMFGMVAPRKVLLESRQWPGTAGAQDL